MGGESGVVAAAVLGVKHQAQVQNVGFQRGVRAVRPQQGEDVFGGGEVRPGGVDVQAAAVFVVVVGLVAVHRDQGEDGDQVDALAHHVGQGDIVGPVVVAGHGEHTPGQGIHHVFAGGLQNDVPHKVGGQAAVKRQLLVEFLQLPVRGQLAEHQKICGLFKAKAFVPRNIAGEILDAVAAVVQFAFAGLLFAVYRFAAHDLADLGETGQHAGAVQIAQAALYVVAHVVVLVDLAVGQAGSRHCFQLGGDAGVSGNFRHKIASSSWPGGGAAGRSRLLKIFMYVKHYSTKPGEKYDEFFNLWARAAKRKKNEKGLAIFSPVCYNTLALTERARNMWECSRVANGGRL